MTTSSTLASQHAVVDSNIPMRLKHKPQFKICTEDEVITIVHGNGNRISIMSTMCDWYEHDRTFIPTWLAGQEVKFIWMGKVPLSYICGSHLAIPVLDMFPVCLEYSVVVYNEHSTWQIRKVKSHSSTLVCRSTVAPAWRSIFTIPSYPFALALWSGENPSCMYGYEWMSVGVWLWFTTQRCILFTFASIWHDAPMYHMFKVGKTYSIFRRGTCQVLYQYTQNMCTMSCDHTEHNRTLPVQFRNTFAHYSSYTCLQLTLTWCYWCILYVL